MDDIYYSNIFNRPAIESRPFDFIYDPGYVIPTSKNFHKLAQDAIRKTSEQEIQPIYGSMFSDIRRFPKSQYVFKTESLPISWEEKAKQENSKSISKIDVGGRDGFKFISKSNIDSPIKIRLENLSKSSAQKINISSIGNEEKVKVMDEIRPVKQIIKFTKSTQTDYRDSETQTDPWISPHDEKLNSMSFLKPEQEPLIEHEIDTMEEKRKINELQKTLMMIDKRNLKTQIEITKKIEKITWLVKEKKIDYINTTRMELAEKLMYKKMYESQVSITRREESYRKLQTEWKCQKMQAIMKNKEREIRKLDQKYQQNWSFFSTSYELSSNRRSNYHANELYDFY